MLNKERSVTLGFRTTMVPLAALLSECSRIPTQQYQKRLLLEMHPKCSEVELEHGGEARRPVAIELAE
jgi:hypothetical protein